jgi:hypothetical protein
MSVDAVQRLYSKKNMVYVTLAGVDYYYSPYLIVYSLVSYPPPRQREKGGVEKIFPVG